MDCLVIRNIEIDRVPFAPGATIENLEEALAIPLIQSGAIKPIAPEAPPMVEIVDTTTTLEGQVAPELETVQKPKLSLADFKVDEARDIIESEIDPDLLHLWLEMEKRKTLKEAITDRIKFLETED
jgi:hypothetical protein